MSPLYIELPEALERLDYFGFTFMDEARMRRARETLATEAIGVVEKFYDHLALFPATRPFLTNRDLVTRLKQSQADYVRSLGSFSRSQPETVLAYFERRFRVGLAHRRVGLVPRLYVGAYSKLGELVIDAVSRGCGADCLPSLHKILLLDSHLATEAYEDARHHEVVEVAGLDELTGLPTRRVLLDRLRAELVRTRRFDHPFGLVFVDVDLFKQINDRFGHAVGDKVLKDVAAILCASSRSADIVGRYAGDEFVLGIVEAGDAEVRAVAERIRVATNELSTHGMPVTLSIGITSLLPSDEIEDLISRADAAMYESKSLGRNRVSSRIPVIADPDKA